MNKIGVLIADDHAILRAGLRLLINAQQDMDVRAEAIDGSDAVEKARVTRPDVALMDFSMPGGGTCTAIEAIRLLAPPTRILILSMHDDPAYLMATVAAGASGYVLKQSADVNLLSAIRTVQRGEPYFDSHLAHALVQQPSQDRVASPAPRYGPRGRGLSPREREVLQLLAQGFTNQQIADRFALSVKTVETHRARLMQKLGLTTRAELVRFAHESGLFPGGVLWTGPLPELAPPGRAGSA